jgi:hypothetical protein
VDEEVKEDSVVVDDDDDDDNARDETESWFSNLPVDGAEGSGQEAVVRFLQVYNESF